ncbi:putative polysaccharide deacetylase [Escherichia coli]|uniref:Putative polysaccharide deacetylase n=12 Tax=Pseudomonadati TaxID=3379134 RepID=A0A2X1NE99_ECOLX|nr:putative polysaccharide deacetylase [Escherichia coli]
MKKSPLQRAELEEKQSEQQTLLYEQRAQQAKLTQALNERKKTLAGLESSIQQGQQQLSELRANESRLRNSIARAEAAAKARAEREAREAQAVRDRQKEATRKGTTYKPTEKRKIADVPLPVVWARRVVRHSGRFAGRRCIAMANSYRVNYAGKVWLSVLLKVTEVKAIADGRVILADWLQGYGLVVVVEHGKGDMSLYGYNQSALVSVGSQVRAGQPIALVGSSGRSGSAFTLFRNSPPGSGGQSTAVVGKISFVSISFVTFLHLPLCWRSPPPYLLANLPSSLMILGIARTTKTRCWRCLPLSPSLYYPIHRTPERWRPKRHNSGHEVLIHLPMAPLSKQPLEKNTLRPEMSSDEIERIIRSAVNNVPYAVGINNHMGSKMTSNLFGMQKVMQALERYNLYFLDSVTIGNTQAMRAAQGTGVKVIKRKVFLDDSQNEADIRVQFNRAIDLARRNGSTIAIGHPHPATVRVLQQMVYNLPPDITLVKASSLLNEPQV